MVEKKKKVRNSLISANAEQILHKRNEDLPSTEKILKNFSNSWLGKVKKWKGFKMYSSHGRSGNVHGDVIEKRQPEMLSMLQKNPINDGLSVDKFGLFYSMNPNATIEPASLLERKK